MLLAGSLCYTAPRFLDQFSTGFMMEDGARAAAAPECKDGLGWIYYNGHCYLFTRSGPDYSQPDSYK